MFNDFPQGQAALYASGGMTERGREAFEPVLEFHDELRKVVAGLMEVGAAVALANQPTASVAPSPNLKTRLSGPIAGRALRHLIAENAGTLAAAAASVSHESRARLCLDDRGITPPGFVMKREEPIQELLDMKCETAEQWRNR